MRELSLQEAAVVGGGTDPVSASLTCVYAPLPVSTYAGDQPSSTIAIVAKIESGGIDQLHEPGSPSV